MDLMYIEVALVVVVVKPPTQNDAFHIVYHSLICLVFFLFQRNFRSLRFFLLVCLIVFGCLSARLTCVASLRVCSKRYAGICLLLCLSPIILFFGRISKYVRLNSLPITHSPTYLVYDYFVVVVSLFFARCFRIRMQAFVLTIYALFSFFWFYLRSLVLPNIQKVIADVVVVYFQNIVPFWVKKDLPSCEKPK